MYRFRKENIMKIKIEKNVPVPKGGRRPKGEFRLALESMEVGDSFLYSAPYYPKKDKLRSLIYHVQNLSKKKFTTASTGGIKRRVWRIE
jgi:hypothetical protein